MYFNTSELYSLYGKLHFMKYYFLHRVVPVKEASIIIAISSAHRKESLEAVQFAIDTVKAVVPVWKKVIHLTNCSSNL